MKDLTRTAAVTPISSHKRFAQKTEAPIPLKPVVPVPGLTSDPDYLADMDSVAAISHLRQCAWIIAHRHGVLTVTEMLRMLSEELLTGFKP
jgi:hypothetical protein